MLTKKFFNENPVVEHSAQRMIYSVMLYERVEEIASEFAKTYIKRAEDEAEILGKESSPEVLLKMMRGNCDPINHPILCARILEQEDLLMPIIIVGLKSSGNDVFIEHAVKLLKKAKNNYCADLINIIDEIRSPYALSLVCIAIGYLGDKSAVPLLLRKHSELKSLFPNETYEQGALLGLIEIRERFKLLH